MLGARTAAAAVSVLAVSAGLVAGAGRAAVAGQAPVLAGLAGSVAPFAAHARVTGEVTGSRRLSVQVWLRPDVAAAQRFAVAVSTPGSPVFHHYESPDGYAARFGAAPRAVAAVESWLRSAGFADVRPDAERSYVRGTASVARIDMAFRVRLRYYQAAPGVNAGTRRLQSNDRPVSVPARLAGSILGVTGLDNAAPGPALQRPRAAGTDAGRAASPAKPDRAECSHYYGQRANAALPRKFGITKFPTLICGYRARQLRSAYGVTGTRAGAGQTLALVELGLARGMFATLRAYAAASHLPPPALRRYAQLALGRGSACGDPDGAQERLDVEASYDMAPGMNQLVVGADTCDHGDLGMQGLINADTAILDGNGRNPLASVVANSWQSGAEQQPASLTGIEHALLVRAAAEGVGMYVAAGDLSIAQSPASDPFAIAVGGTTLGIGRAGHRLFETGWSTAIFLGTGSNGWSRPIEIGATSGGRSMLWQQPGYQRGVVPGFMSTVGGARGNGPVRSAPDISADADPDTGIAVGTLSAGGHGPPRLSLSPAGGTSLATALVAGMVTAAQQGQHAPFGFLDPALYRLAGTGALSDPLPLTSHSPVLWRAMSCSARLCGFPQLFAADIQAPTPMLGYTGQVTRRGYDNMTGVGTPGAPGFAAALRGLEQQR